MEQRVTSSSVNYSDIQLPCDRYAETVLERTKEELETVHHAQVDTKEVVIKRRKEAGPCYTCHPKPYHQKFIYEEKNNCKFHFDLTNRSYIIATPLRHVETIYQLTRDELHSMIQTIRAFCDERNITNYQLSTNMGEWKTHSHLHWKIKIAAEFLHRLRDDHFALLKYKKNYKDESKTN